MGEQDWRRFLERFSEELLAADDIRLHVPEEVRRERWMGYGLATEKAIATAELRLGRSLPPSLRSFYAVSNGWRETGFFIWNVLPVEEIGWLREKEPGLYGLACEAEAEPGPFLRDPGGMRLQHYREEQGTRVKRALVLNSRGDAATWLLDPGALPLGGEWLGGRWAGWNPAMRWTATSFADLMKQELESFLQLRNRERASPQ
jgi:hypothetical protein